MRTEGLAAGARPGARTEVAVSRVAARAATAVRAVAIGAGDGDGRGDRGGARAWMLEPGFERYHESQKNLCRLKSREIIRETHMRSKLIVSKVAFHK